MTPPGRRTVNTEPLPGSLTTVTSPPKYSPLSGGYVHSRTLRPPSYVAHDARDSFTEVSLINLAPLRRGFSFGRLLI
jgi:hypothetical protein